jgi:peptidoglycan/LPS O-acetylase OafA/YrhL
MRFLLASIVAVAHISDFEKSPFSMFCAASLDAKAAVVGFLVISGFSIAASLDRDPNGFYFRRFKRIYPIYFFAVLLGIRLSRQAYSLLSAV